MTSVIASSGPATGGQQVTVLGTNLASPIAVDFGVTSATIVSSTATTVTVTSPPGSAGTIDVTVTTAGGTSATSICRLLPLRRRFDRVCRQLQLRKRHPDRRCL